MDDRGILDMDDDDKEEEFWIMDDDEVEEFWI